MQAKLPFFTLLLLISFASVNAVLFTPALPSIAQFFGVSEDAAQQTITWFLVGYAVGQLIYGPIANRFGRKIALNMGITLQIVSSLLCVLAGMIHQYWLLVLARFMLALGSGVGLKMTFTLVNECYEPKIASQKISYLMLAFAITPGLSMALGGMINTYYGWMSCFYAGAIYGVILLFFVSRLPETQTILDLNALKIKHLLQSYCDQFKNIKLISGGLLMGGMTSLIYVFAALAPFIAITLFGMSSAEYGFANLLPSIGIIGGSLMSAQLVKLFRLESIILTGIGIIGGGILFIFIALLLHFSIIFSLFFPMIIIYFGGCFIAANSSALAMSQTHDKAHGSAVMSFINMGSATLVVLSLSFFPMSKFLLPVVYGVLCVLMLGVFILLNKKESMA